MTVIIFRSSARYDPFTYPQSDSSLTDNQSQVSKFISEVTIQVGEKERNRFEIFILTANCSLKTRLGSICLPIVISCLETREWLTRLPSGFDRNG